MRSLLTIHEQDIHPKAPAVDTSDFHSRKAARGVVLDPNNAVYLLHVSAHGYHKLPGGGIKDNEDIHGAFQRELLEEIGCQATIIRELGIIVEYRNQWSMVQTSYCFLARQDGEQREPTLEDDEIAEGFQVVKAPSIDEAIRLLEADKPDNYDGQFIQRRDIVILKAATHAI